VWHNDCDFVIGHNKNTDFQLIMQYLMPHFFIYFAHFQYAE